MSLRSFAATLKRTGKLPLGWLLALALLTGSGVVFSACSASADSVPEGPTQAADQEKQASEGGQVTVTVTWGGVQAGSVFLVEMDTHSVDLDGYDLLELAVLRTEEGREVKAIAWDAPKGGHHRSGTVTFPATASDGSPLIAQGAGTIELVIRDIAGVPERVFRWAL